MLLRDSGSPKFPPWFTSAQDVSRPQIPVLRVLLLSFFSSLPSLLGWWFFFSSVPSFSCSYSFFFFFYSCLFRLVALFHITIILFLSIPFCGSSFPLSASSPISSSFSSFLPLSIFSFPALPLKYLLSPCLCIPPHQFHFIFIFLTVFSSHHYFFILLNLLNLEALSRVTRTDPSPRSRSSGPRNTPPNDLNGQFVVDS